jgi:Flp pilus assembly protein TadB
VSRERARRREVREAEAVKARQHRDARARTAAGRRDRSARRQRLWRSVRLWRSPAGARREHWAALGAVALIVVLGIWFATRSVSVVVFTVLVAVIVGPAVLVLSADRRNRP